jgi:beta-lactamase class D
MKKSFLFLVFTAVFYNSAFANSNCFLLTENNKIIEKSGDCKTRHSPCSTFKIAISLMGYDVEFLKDENHPEFPFEKEYVIYAESWKQPQTPKSWIKNSCVWYSQLITKKLGVENFRNYVEKFNYGNRDISGDEGKNNGLTEAWLGSSLKISPQEQLEFLQKLLDKKLPVKDEAIEMTKNILFIEDLPNGWKFYGKSGSCDSTINNQQNGWQNGWFVGWIEKDNRKIIAVNHINDKTEFNYSAGKKAREEVGEKMINLINNF